METRVKVTLDWIQLRKPKRTENRQNLNSIFRLWSSDARPLSPSLPPDSRGDAPSQSSSRMRSLTRTFALTCTTCTRARHTKPTSKNTTRTIGIKAAATRQRKFLFEVVDSLPPASFPFSIVHFFSLSYSHARATRRWLGRFIWKENSIIKEAQFARDSSWRLIAGNLYTRKPVHEEKICFHRRVRRATSDAGFAFRVFVEGALLENWLLFEIDTR